MNVKEEAKKYKDYTIDLRREFHSNPEPSLEEYETIKRIEEELRDIGIAYEIVGETGIVATIEGNRAGKKIALRADIDGLKIDDLKAAPYRSKNEGLSHACGHDGHAAMLLTAGRILYENIDKINGTVLLIFQPGEESSKGAKKMLEDKNFLDGIDTIFAIHLMVTMEVGSVGYTYGATLSSSDSFFIELQGKGGHGAGPHRTKDPLVAACSLVMDAQHIVSRKIPPSKFGVLTFGYINAGTKSNIIPDTASIKGSIRSYDEETRNTIKNSLKRVIKGCSHAHDVAINLRFSRGPYAVVNSNKYVDLAKESMEKIFDKENILEKPPMSASDDFSYYLQKVKGVYIPVGAGNEKKGITYPHHHPKFDIDEDALESGVALYIQYTLDFLNNY